MSELSKSLFEMVRAFHVAFGHDAPDEPVPMNQNSRAVRAGFMREELAEFLDADCVVARVDALLDLLYFVVGTGVAMGQPLEFYEGVTSVMLPAYEQQKEFLLSPIARQIYDFENTHVSGSHVRALEGVGSLVCGVLRNSGLEVLPLFTIVHGANMAKLWEDGKPRWREGDGKVLKPEGWRSPEGALAVAMLGMNAGIFEEERQRIDTADMVWHVPTGEMCTVACVKGDVLYKYGHSIEKVLLNDCVLVAVGNEDARVRMWQEMVEAGVEWGDYGRMRLGVDEYGDLSDFVELMDDVFVDPDNVRLVASALLERFDKLVVERGENELPYLDVLMGFHNAYKRVIVMLEEQSGGVLFRDIAIDTLVASLPRGTTGYVWDTQVLGGGG